VQILVISGLTYGNEHLVNADSQHSDEWAAEAACRCEVHPATVFLIMCKPRWTRKSGN
jgi:hypothetical protein